MNHPLWCTVVGTHNPTDCTSTTTDDKPDGLDRLYSAVIELIPTAVFDTDNDGQLIIYTNLKVVELFRADGQVEVEVRPFEEDE